MVTVNNITHSLQNLFIILCFLPQFIIFCGKDIYPSQGISLEKVLATGARELTKGTIDLAKTSLGNLEGIEELPLSKCRKLYLCGNHLENLDPLLKTKSKKLRYIYLQNNKLKNITPETLLTLQEKFPNLRLVNLRNNGIENIQAFEECQSQLTYTVKLNKIITIEDD